MEKDEPGYFETTEPDNTEENEAASSGSTAISATPSQQPPARSTNVNQDLFAVKARGISLYN